MPLVLAGKHGTIKAAVVKWGHRAPLAGFKIGIAILASHIGILQQMANGSAGSVGA